jgi:hypothetical protein
MSGLTPKVDSLASVSAGLGDAYSITRNVTFVGNIIATFSARENVDTLISCVSKYVWDGNRFV